MSDDRTDDDLRCWQEEGQWRRDEDEREALYEAALRRCEAAGADPDDIHILRFALGCSAIVDTTTPDLFDNRPARGDGPEYF